MDHARYMRQIDREIESGRAELLRLYDDGVAKLRRALDYQHSERFAAIKGHRDFEAFLNATIRGRALRKSIMPSDIFGEPGWEIMLDLTLARLRNLSVSVSNVATAGGTPVATGLRWISALGELGLIERIPHERDQRRIIIRLSDAGWDLMNAWLEKAVLL